MLSSERVQYIFKDCLYNEDELVDGKPNIVPVVAEGIRCNYGLHPERLKNYEPEIIDMLNELPLTFKDGWSFLNMCIDRNERQWTDFHFVCELLMVLGIAIGKIKYCIPKDMWNLLPGGVPYITININTGGEEIEKP